jgi:hypothetical protein
MKIKNLILIFPFLVFQAFSATNSVRYSIPGAIELRREDGICSGSIVGDAPIKVLTAVHCLKNLVDGGVEIIDPVATQVSGKVKWVKSSKAYLPKNARYLELLEKKNKLSLEVEELTLVASMAAEKLRGSQPNSGFLLGGLLLSAPKPGLSKEEEAKLAKTIQESVMSLQKLGPELVQLENKINVSFVDHDIAVVVFPTSLVGTLSVEERIKNREILPIARSSSKESDIPVVIGGFGFTAMGPQGRFPMRNGADSSPQMSHFTTNVLSKNPKKPSVYSLFGNTSENLKKSKVAPATMGSPLPGDSGSAVLSDEGILAVTSIISFYSSHTPPAPNWVNLVDEPDSVVERYDYIAAYFPSTTSPIAQEIFAEVEATSGPLVYADQVLEYSKVFVSERQSILATGNSNPLLDLFKMPSIKIVVR